MCTFSTIFLIYFKLLNSYLNRNLFANETLSHNISQPLSTANIVANSFRLLCFSVVTRLNLLELGV